jgi:hypothetical protein
LKNFFSNKLNESIYYLLTTFIFQLISLLTFTILLKIFDEKVLNSYFYILSLTSILIGVIFIGNDKAFLYTKNSKDNIFYFNNSLKLILLFTSILILISIFFKSKILFFCVINFFFLSINYLSEILFFKNSSKYKVILFKNFNIIFFIILIFLINFEYLKIDLLLAYSAANLLNFFFNIVGNKYLHINLKIIKFSNLSFLFIKNKSLVYIWLGDLFSILTFHLPTIFLFNFFSKENIIYNILYKFGFIPVFLINFAFGKVFDFNYFDNKNNNNIYKGFLVTRKIIFIFSILYCIFFYIIVNNFSTLLFGNYHDLIPGYLNKGIILFFIMINASSLGSVFYIKKKYQELLYHQIANFFIIVFSLIILLLTKKFELFFNYLIYLSIIRYIILYISINKKINFFKNAS